MLRFDRLTRAYGAREIFHGISGQLQDGMTVGLVGPNGAGKSSLVRLLAGVDEPDAGRVVRARDTHCGYLTQSANADAGVTLRELLEAAFARERAEEAQLRELEVALAATSSSDEATQERALRRYGEAREIFDRRAGAGFESRMRGMLSAFDFDEGDLDRPTSDFSGGQRTRASLARLLLEEPDYLILDEPTNHLDLETVRWLEDFLGDDSRATLVVSHDRYFLDRVANEIWDLDGGELERYVVPRGRAYAAYLEEKAARRELAERAYARFRDEEARRKAVVAELRTHGSHNYSHVRSREKQLAKLERVDAPKTSQAAISVKLEAARRATGGLALSAKHLRVAYDAPLFDELSFEVRRGERIAIVGPNGAGKSTLLDVLSGRRAPDRGEVRIMPGVSSAYFAQDAADDLPEAGTAVEAVLEGATVTSQEARALLGRLGLGGDAGDKPVDAFSGGERRRIMLARLMARSADLLFLDEPTNDLDIASREALEAVLDSYGGAMLVVSHDRYLLRRLAERVLWLQDGRVAFVDGYERFESAQHHGVHATSAPAANPANPRAASAERGKPDGRTVSLPSAKRGREAKSQRDRDARTLATAEREVARLDEERARLEREFADPAIYDDRVRVAELETELEAARAAVEEALARWEELAANV